MQRWRAWGSERGGVLPTSSQDISEGAEPETPSKALFSLTLPAFLTLGRLRSWGREGRSLPFPAWYWVSEGCRVPMGSGSESLGGIQAPFHRRNTYFRENIQIGLPCPSLCYPTLALPAHWPLFYLHTLSWKGPAGVSIKLTEHSLS